MRITTNILALLLCLAVLTASVGFTADNETDRLKQDVEYLCSPGLAGRDVPSIEGDMTAIWLAEQFYSIGLLPAMNGTSYLQEVPLEVGWLDTVATTLTIRGSDWEIECRWRQDFYVIPRDLSGFEAEYEAEFCHYGIDAPELGKQDFKDLNDGNAAVVLLGSGDIPREKAGRHALTPFKAAAANRAGAGLLLVIVPSYNGHTFPPDEIKHKIEEINHKIVSLPGSEPDFPVVYLDGGCLERVITGSVPLEYWLKENREEPFLSGVRIYIKVAFRDKYAERAFNVIGKIPGEQPEFVIISAHYDHLGRIENTGKVQMDYYPGADDNASGVAGMLEICRRWISREKPGHGLIAVGFAAEEDGLLGSKYLCDNTPVECDLIIAVVNLDMIGRRGFRTMRESHNPQSEPDSNYAAVYYSGAAPRLENIIRGARDMGGLDVEISPVNGFPFSDAGSFHNSHIPTIHLFGGFNAGYNTLEDTPDGLDYKKLARMVLLTDRILVNLIEEPGEIEFHPEIRVKSAGMNY